ncbi:MAG: alginate export family protein [Candidatus Omnitrophica bacterium]|nr:alginate export family protein [Candidatus Omnitrophota bacterium]
MKRIIGLTSFILMVVCSISVNSAFAGESLKDALMEGKPYADVRYRYEYVDQKNVNENAKASTLRTRLGYKSGKWYDFVGVIEGENVSYIGSDDYNDTVNRRTDHPVVADPENTQINQAYLEYSGIPNTIIKGGRQVIALDDHRFIGHVGWRQNNQVFDAGVLTNNSIENTTVMYGFIYNVNRIFGEQSAAGDWKSQSHFYNISNTSLPIGKITTYGYILDFGDDSSANSSATFGLSLSGKKALNDEINLKYYGAYANQSDFASNATDYNANYYHIAPALEWKGLTTTVGYEVLGSDSSKFGFATPLATLHKFNGWADKFLSTPATGLEDFYVDLGYKVAGLEGNLEFFNGLLAKFQYHDFQAEDGGADYGNEWGIYLKHPIKKNMYVETKYADYNADSFSTDTKKWILGFGLTY